MYITYWAKTENGNSEANFPVDPLGPAWSVRAEMTEAQSNSPFIRATPCKGGRVKSKLLSVMIGSGAAGSLGRAREKDRHDSVRYLDPTQF